MPVPKAASGQGLPSTPGAASRAASGVGQAAKAVGAAQNLVQGKGPSADTVMNTMGSMASKTPMAAPVKGVLIAKDVVAKNLGAGVER